MPRMHVMWPTVHEWDDGYFTQRATKNSQSGVDRRNLDPWFGLPLGRARPKSMKSRCGRNDRQSEWRHRSEWAAYSQVDAGWGRSAGTNLFYQTVAQPGGGRGRRGSVQARQNGLCISDCTSKRAARSRWPSSPSIANSCRERARSRHSPMISRVCRNVLVSIG